MWSVIFSSNRRRRLNSFALFALLRLLVIRPASTFTLVNDVKTPCLLVDVDRLLDNSPCLPSIHLPQNDVTLYPHPTKDLDSSIDVGEENDKFDISTFKGQSALIYLHSSVIRERESVTEDDAPLNAFLAELDLSPPSLLASEKAQLVLGINNHHVGSYYWARSVGMGASMEAPGISFGSGTTPNQKDKGILRWEDDGGPLDCNSNDGKRSEWVNFLRVKDNVQLIPQCDEDAFIAFVERYEDEEEKNGSRVYGFSSKSRPLGSEPIIVCKWSRNE
mmetsp:Transcript_6696/g.9860  ORF Transcript_6696/g.9860 Transcript_6696/m.9860 type:complete len:276 (-) Transcript_6696:54-881(-)